MAEIQPLRGWRYNAVLSANIDAYVSPLFDVVSAKQREALYRNPLNSIHLSVPRGDDPAEEALVRLREWEASGVLRQDELPGIYVYYQYFQLPGSPRQYCRKGFMCHIRAYDWDENVVLRHENTLPASVNDRAELLARTQFQTSATHGLYRDEDFELEAYLDEAMLSPLVETEEDYQGARDVLAVIQDAAVIRRFQEVLARREVILADGHHRYEGSLAYRQARELAAEGHATGREPWNYHLMYLTNAAADDLRILPTHRLLLDLPGNPSPGELLDRLAPYFTVLPIEDASGLPEIIAGKQWAFGLYIEGEAFKIRLRPEVHAQLNWDTTEEVKALDLTVLHFFVLEKVLGIVGPDAQRAWPGVAYVRNFTECLQRVDRGEARAALIVNEVTMAEVEAVCHSGAVMPPKSTFFYPKTIGGFLFSSIADEEAGNAFAEHFQANPA
ncbi:DUF1015 domain-containing protein [Hymenobacter negativus]|uniref:DUF1015 domain-containing protein n=1 Tax=Hymenobacter negativus TaxID=2795026 RepID=A0ABS0Q375_9BACT|nr:MULTISPECIES: DUF1015 domain-containing protein [Bacteria]MBH8557093.1 DUF1015 domain-containing protein [Hymenobacter negativus]MBH8569334.1 DUF1015 domain-containing protein [Hymenobacter negativus]MBR7209068.1 DUF1015 domain-containing protein [Microvirga sp. STS02]